MARGNNKKFKNKDFKSNGFKDKKVKKDIGYTLSKFLNKLGKNKQFSLLKNKKVNKNTDYIFSNSMSSWDKKKQFKLKKKKKTNFIKSKKVSSITDFIFFELLNNLGKEKQISKLRKNKFLRLGLKKKKRYICAFFKNKSQKGVMIKPNNLILIDISKVSLSKMKRLKNYSKKIVYLPNSFKNESQKSESVKFKKLGYADISREIEKIYFKPKSVRNYKRIKFDSRSLFLNLHKKSKFFARNHAFRIIFKLLFLDVFKNSDKLWDKFKKNYLIGNNLFWFLFFFKSFYFLAFRVSFSLWLGFLKLNLILPKSILSLQLVRSGYLELYEKRFSGLLYQVQSSYISQKSFFFSLFEIKLLPSYFLKRAVLFFNSFSLIDLKFYKGFINAFCYPKHYLFAPFFRIYRHQRYNKKKVLARSFFKLLKKKSQRKLRSLFRINGRYISSLKHIAKTFMNSRSIDPKLLKRWNYSLLPYKKRKKLERKRNFEFKKRNKNFKYKINRERGNKFWNKNYSVLPYEKRKKLERKRNFEFKKRNENFRYKINRERGNKFWNKNYSVLPYEKRKKLERKRNFEFKKGNKNI